MPTRVPCPPKAGGVTGAQLLGKVLSRWPHLPEPHFRALARMALTALDEANGRYPAALYWGGRELIARTWQQPFPDGDGDEDGRRRKSILNTVTVVCRELRAEGAIEVASGDRLPGPGRRQVFLLTLDNDPTGAIRKLRDEENAARQGRKRAALRLKWVGGPPTRMGGCDPLLWVGGPPTPRNH